VAEQDRQAELDPKDGIEPEETGRPTPEEEDFGEVDEAMSLDDKKASRNLRNGLISLIILIALIVGLVLDVPGLHQVAEKLEHFPLGWIFVGVGLEALSCICYIIAFLQVFDRAPRRFGARVALSELAFGAAVSLGGAGSVAVGAWLLIERGAKPSRVAERSAVLFLLTSAVNIVVLAVVGLSVWVGILPGKQDPLLSLVPGAVGVLAFVGFLSLPWFTRLLVGEHPKGRMGRWMTATSDTILTTWKVLITPDWRLIGAWGYLLFDIAVLYICFHALGHAPPVSTVILAYQIGYLSNFIPIPGGIGILDGSFVGMFVLYGINASEATSATLVYHAISLWVPAVWGTIAFILLRRSRHQPLELRVPRPRLRRNQEN
jgi:uncharacterized membrane protein YbhN (UPF0104 family)